MTGHYFAYGSNMDLDRMLERVPGAQVAGCGSLEDERIHCNKLGRDGSGKANLVASPGSIVWGVVYRVSAADLERLDEFERGYRRIHVEIRLTRGESIRAQTYRGERLTDHAVPFDWYHALMLRGARTHGLPTEYIALLQALPVRPSREGD